MTNDFKQTTPRRTFLGTLASGAAALGLMTIAAPVRAKAESLAASDNVSEADAWFNKVKGKHRIVFDATEPKEIFTFAWPRVFLMTNDKTGTMAADCGVVVVLRHNSIAYAFEDRIWSTYGMGEVFNIDDPATKARSTRNPFWKPKPGDYKVPGIGNVAIGINELMESGVMFCVCDAASTVYSAVVAEKMGKDAAIVKKDWYAGLLPGVQVVPSGVWAVGRAQEHGCHYCFVG